MATVETLVTLEEFAAMPDDGIPTELVSGRIIRVPPPKHPHGRICFKIAWFIGNHVIDRGLGELATNDSGVVTHRNPDTVRGADVAYYSTAKIPPIDQPIGYPELPPDLVVEVRSPSDRWVEMVRKAAEYLEAGVLVVVVLDPATRSAHVFEPDSPVHVLGPDDTLTFPGLLGDFAVLVARIFD